MPQDKIVIHGAREHNLKNIDVTIPRDKLVVITGLSGSGKSSLAFDTIFAEGQRRYIESLSAYARQFLDKMEKPDVDHIDGLSPAISIDQKGTTHNPRSTVGTVTEIYDYLRLLYARIGHAHCPTCGREVSQQTIQQIVDAVLNLPEGSRILLLAPLVQGRKGEYKNIFEEMRHSGYVRVRVDGKIFDLSDEIDLDKQKKHTIEVVVDVQAVTRQGKGGKWNAAFSPVQVGKEHLYRLLREMGLTVHLKEGWQTKELRERYGLKKTTSKAKRCFEAHAVDSWVLAACISGAQKPSCTRLWYVVPAFLHRRQLHRLQASKGGRRKPYGGTRSLGLKRGTVIRHAQYGLCTVGGFDRKKQTISLHDYRTNQRLTQGAKVEACRVLTWVAWRSWFVVEEQRASKGKGAASPLPRTRNASFLPPLDRGGFPEAEVS